jgi:hypothetical protein
MIKKIIGLFCKQKPEKIELPDIEKMECKLGYLFHECDVHRCSTFGCLRCGQFIAKNNNNNKK